MLMTLKDLRIALWNAVGILNKKAGLDMFLGIRKVDVCVISETRFMSE